MSELAVAVAPLVVFWTVPVVPLFVAAVVGAAEAVTQRGR
jgi:hypothetical protein